MDSPLHIHRLAPDVCVAPQLDAGAMAELARLGFRSVINNRPDFEHDASQPTNASVAAAAATAGLEYRFLPVSGGYQSPEEIAAFAELLKVLPRPVLAFCRSGARSSRLFAEASKLST